MKEIADTQRVDELLVEGHTCKTKTIQFKFYRKLNSFYKRNSDVCIGLLIVILGLAIGITAVLLYSHSMQKDKAKPQNVQDQASDLSMQSQMDTGVFGEVKTYSSDDGDIVIGGEFTATPMSLTKDPDTIWDSEQYTGNFTPVEKAALKNGSLGVLTIDRINLSTNVYESTTDMETLGHDVGHFPSTSAWDGNIGLSSHNVNLDGSNGKFLDIHRLQQGDIITYQTALGERTYKVVIVKTIAQDDWSYLSHSDENKITLITCISGQPDTRLVVQAVEINR